MDKLLRILKERIANGTDKPCITGNIIKDPEAKLNEGAYSLFSLLPIRFPLIANSPIQPELTCRSTAEIKSICLTMVSAGLDTVPGNLIMGIAYLASPEGQKIQQRAHAAILEAYPNNDAWHRCLHEEKIPYLTALYKEILRYWTVIPICLPRVSTKPIPYNDAVIPAGTTFYMNAYAADYDATHFEDPHVFRPERYLDAANDGSGTPHYGYGAGSRMCVGSHLGNRELFTAFVRLISAFEFLPPRDPRDVAEMDCLKANAIPTSLTMEPKAFKVRFRPRDRGLLERWIGESEERTRELM
jgi:phenylacetate 2-hydroxylase